MLIRPATTALLVLLSSTVAAAQTWSDDFESYPNGSALEGQGGWEGWDGMNTTFTVVSQAQAHGGMQSIQANPGADSVQQFTPPSGGTWVFEAWLYVPSTFTSALDFMVMNDYQHGGPYEWGSWLIFDGTTLDVTCNCGGSSAANVPLPFDRWVEVREVIDLDNDNADIYFDGQLLTSYVWTDGWSGNANHLVPSIDALDIFATGAGDGIYIDDIRLYQMVGTVGTRYCDPAVANSTGAPAGLDGVGVPQVASNDVTLVASSLPLNAFGFFLASQAQGQTMNPGGSQGTLCLGGAIGRYVGPGQIQSSGSTGDFSLALDLTQTPQPTGFVSVAAGETWYYQSWYRDAIGGSATSNFTNGLEIAYQ